MLWLGTSPKSEPVVRLLDTQQIGFLSQPTSNPPRVGWLWAADNGAFGVRFDEARWLRWLDRDHPRSGCLFAAVPDVVGDHVETLRRFERWHDRVRELRYPVAFVAQDGADESSIPWDSLDCLFIGGTTAFKQSPRALELAHAARERRKWIHVGRVNSLKRLTYWADHADSSDGSFLSYGPDVNAPRVEQWVNALRSARQLALVPEIGP